MLSWYSQFLALNGTRRPDRNSKHARPMLPSSGSKLYQMKVGFVGFIKIPEMPSDVIDVASLLPLRVGGREGEVDMEILALYSIWGFL